ncbi:hypothetical protein NEIPOLOT_01877 [Neisseria polysaccharea ATCC 43768]|nr:hypothetical protein NEIPOLOT_01877 [Neisseria polysaccharea ATCC 43768]
MVTGWVLPPSKPFSFKNALNASTAAAPLGYFRFGFQNGDKYRQPAHELFRQWQMRIGGNQTVNQQRIAVMLVRNQIPSVAVLGGVAYDRTHHLSFLAAR